MKRLSTSPSRMNRTNDRAAREGALESASSARAEAVTGVSFSRMASAQRYQKRIMLRKATPAPAE
jgi:hypothetical protein